MIQGSKTIIALGAAVAALAFAQSCHGQAGGDGSAALVEGMSGMWQISPRGPGPGGPPEGREGFGSPPQGRLGPGAGGRGQFGPPPDGPPGARGAQLPGPDIEGLDEADRRIYSVMTEKGRAAFEAMDPHDLPANNCLSNGLPSLVGIPDVQEWSFGDGKLTIHYASFDTVRTIWLDGRAAEGRSTLLGHSVGRFSGGELVIATDHLTATPGGLARNAPGSAVRSYVERYHLSADGTQVSGLVTMHDPEYLTRDLSRPIAFARAAEGTEIPEDVGCSVEASQRYLDD